MIRILLVDDHQVLLDGVKSLLEHSEGFIVVAMAHNGQEAVDALSEQPIDVVLMDIHMPVMDGLEACKRIKTEKPEVKVIAMSMYGEGQMVQALLNNGANGYLLKSCGAEELVEAVRTVHGGGTWLSKEATTNLVGQLQRPVAQERPSYDQPSDRELAVLKLISKERTTSEIGKELGISENTVESHRRQLLQKLGARNSAGLVRIAMERGLI